MKATIERTANGYKVWFMGVFCPRLGFGDANILAQRINTMARERDPIQARIRLASYCVTVGVNE